VYLGGSLALVVLELFVHMGKAHANLQFVSFKVEFEDDLVEDLQKVPRNWRQEPPPRQAKDLGTRWAQNAFSPALRVPSVIVPVESNYLLNVQHLDFGKIVIGKPEPFGFDPRMWK
jgi:RES domain-containing protein